MEGKIKIVRRPEGEAPPEVRDEWIGIEIPCLYRHTEESSEVIVIGAISGDIMEKFTPMYAVFQQVALNLLGQKSPEAQEWWARHGYPERGRYPIFYFNADCAEPIGHIPTREDLKGMPGN